MEQIDVIKNLVKPSCKQRVIIKAVKPATIIGNRTGKTPFFIKLKMSISAIALPKYSLERKFKIAIKMLTA